MIALSRSVAALLAVFLAPSVASADTYPRQPSVDAVHYVFRVVVTDGSNEISGETTVTMKARSDGVRDIELDLTSAASGKGMTVGAVIQQVAGAPLSLAFTHRTDRLRVSLPAPLMTGDAVSFTVTYAGIPAEGLRLIDNIHGERVVFSENWPNRARQWLPTIDTRTTRPPANSSSPRHDLLVQSADGQVSGLPCDGGAVSAPGTAAL